MNRDANESTSTLLQLLKSIKDKVKVTAAGKEQAYRPQKLVFSHGVHMVSDLSDVLLCADQLFGVCRRRGTETESV